MDTAVRSQSVDTTVPTSLGQMRPGMAATIVAVGSVADGVSQLELRLLELGFSAGERVEVVAESRPGRDPFVVRVGSSQFALRRCEAQNIWVEDACPIER
jgi:ferrous iron transport protein A